MAQRKSQLTAIAELLSRPQDVQQNILGGSMSQDASTIITALALYTIATVSPGPTFALISRLAASGARPAAFGATFGMAIGASVYAILTMTGLALVISRVGWLATTVQIAGGCYLIYLGVTAWLSSSPAKSDTQGKSQRYGALRGLRMGMIVELSNPKSIGFFLSFFAVAIPQGTALWAKIAILAGGFAVEIVWFGLVTVLLSSPPVQRLYDRFRLWIERMVGTVLAGFGIRLISEKL